MSKRDRETETINEGEVGKLEDDVLPGVTGVPGDELKERVRQGPITITDGKTGQAFPFDPTQDGSIAAAVASAHSPDLPLITLEHWAATQGMRRDQFAGFRVWCRRKQHTQFTIPGWLALYNSFLVDAPGT